jgi:hypothetical protein
MKKISFLLLFFAASTAQLWAGIIVIEGKYQDKNLYVQNGYAGNGVGYCTYEVSINGQTSTDEVNSSAFEIDFAAFQIKPGTPVVVENEMGSLPFIVEQFRWNKWIPVGEVQGNGAMEDNSYSFKTTPHSGENKFRVKQIGFGGVSKASNGVTFTSTASQPSYTMSKGNNIQFSAETMYEVFDLYGNIIKRGYGSQLEIANLSKGSYYLCYDNIMTDFKKK